MPPVSGSFVGTFYPNEVGGGPIVPPSGGGQPGVPTHPIYNPPGIWGPPGPWPTPPIYIPVGDPPEVWLPVFPTNPIVIPQPPTEGGEPQPPVVWPPLPGGVPPVGGYPGYPAPPLGIWGGGNVPMPNPPIYLPIPPPNGGDEPPHIWVPVFPTPPIHLGPGGEVGGPPVVGGGPILPQIPPDMINPPSGARGFWGWSPGYGCMVFVPYQELHGPSGPGDNVPEMPPAVPA